MNFRNANKFLKAFGLKLAWGQNTGRKTRVLVKRSRIHCGRPAQYTIGVFSVRTLLQGFSNPTMARDQSPFTGSRPNDGWNLDGSTWGGSYEGDTPMNMSAPQFNMEQLQGLKDALMMDRLVT